MQEIRLIFEQVGRSLPHSLFEEFRLVRADAVPGLGFSPVHIVDGVTPVILDMPAKGGEAHADVAPGHLHPANVAADVAQDRSLQHRKDVEIPTRIRVFFVFRVTLSRWRKKNKVAYTTPPLLAVREAGKY